MRCKSHRVRPTATPPRVAGRVGPSRCSLLTTLRTFRPSADDRVGGVVGLTCVFRRNISDATGRTAAGTSAPLTGAGHGE